LDGGGGGGLGPSSPLVDGGGSIRGWLLMAVCGGCWWMVGCSLPFVGGGGVTSSPFVVGAGGWWWCSCRHVGDAGRSSLFVGGAAGCSTLVVCVVRHCASFVGVVIIRHHFILRGDVAADVSAGLPIGEV